MNKNNTTNRSRIVATAGEMLYRQGYIATSVDDIVAATGVSKSNFYYHFASKEDLGLAVLCVRRDGLERLLDETIRAEALTPRSRLAGFLSHLLDNQETDLGSRGCPFGNLAAEMTEHSERIRCFLSGVFSDLECCIHAVVSEGQGAGDFRTDVDAAAVAALIVQSLQGMHLMTKCHRNPQGSRPTAQVLMQLIRAEL